MPSLSQASPTAVGFRPLQCVSVSKRSRHSQLGLFASFRHRETPIPPTEGPDSMASSPRSYTNSFFPNFQPKSARQIPPSHATSPLAPRTLTCDPLWIMSESYLAGTPTPRYLYHCNIFTRTNSFRHWVNSTQGQQRVQQPNTSHAPPQQGTVKRVLAYYSKQK